jgi:hypothetical protein
MEAAAVVVGVSLVMILVIALVALVLRRRTPAYRYRRAALDLREMGNGDPPDLLIFPPENGPTTGTSSLA